jgi:hypothetical protein
MRRTDGGNQYALDGLIYSLETDAPIHALSPRPVQWLPGVASFQLLIKFCASTDVRVEDAPRASRRTASWSTDHATVYTEWRRKGEGEGGMCWCGGCGGADADASCHRSQATGRGAGAAPAAASRHSDSLTALHPPPPAAVPLPRGSLTDRQITHPLLRATSDPLPNMKSLPLPLPLPPTGGAGGHASRLPGLHRAPRN